MPHRGRDRYQGELIRLAVTELQVDRLAGHRRRGYLDRDDQLAVLQRMLTLRRVTGKQEELVDRDGPFTARPARVHDRIQGDQRDCDIRGMSGDALVAGAEDGVPAVEAIQGRAAAAGIALIARRRRIAEIAAPHPLAQVAAHRGHVPQLRRGSQQQRLRDDREPLHHAGRLGDVAHPRQRADAKAAVGQVLDAGSGAGR